MKTKLTLEFVPEPTPDAEERHDELIDLLAAGIALALCEEAREEAEAALGRPLRTAVLGEEASPEAPSPLVRRRLRQAG